MARSRDLWAAISALAAVAMTVWAIGLGTTQHRTESAAMFVQDSLGMPRLDVDVLTGDGTTYEPSLDGLIHIPQDRAGQSALLRERATRRELCAFTIPRSGSQTIRIRVPPKGGGCM